MGTIFYKEPKLESPDMIASWPGIGNIGVVAIDTLRGQLRAEALGEIEPWDFFYPKKVIIKSGLLVDLQFPASRFFFKKAPGKEVVFFVGEEQPSDGSGMYAEGKKAFQMANAVLDVAEKMGCRRIYTSGAAVALTHHAMRPRVWVVASDRTLLGELKSCPNTVLMSEVEGRGGGGGSITGLNGLLLGLAKKRGFQAVCLMGEIPDYLSGAPFPYPRASRSILEVLTRLLGVTIDYQLLDDMTVQVDEIIEGIYEKLPAELKEKVEQRKVMVQPWAAQITEEDEKWLKEHIDELFQKGGRGDERPA
ncbi:MAG: PAC2 family protein [Chloroflexi bacterium]|nr:PAC2 family protein [Chloroflexota bacterium]